ncbi:MAG: YraN family protein, partial [Pseudomonadota bacterium]
MPERSSAQSGKDAELQALEYLRQQGLRLLAQNWLCKRGELDLVMLDGDTVVF